ncbi:MAG: hypothetical protein ACI85I_001140 [Arenicella sp.]|jgi:hypothetical protein
MGYKILGYILMICSVLITLSLFNNLVSFIAPIFDLLQDSNSYESGYAIGNFTALILLIALAIFCWSYGRKLSVKKKV